MGGVAGKTGGSFRQAREAWAKESGIPVVADAAGSFDRIAAEGLGTGKVPVVISLHATKTFSTAEGGLVVCADGEFMQRCERALNFGFMDSRDSIGPSLNGKLSEYHAAVGLAELDGWARKRAGFLMPRNHTGKSGPASRGIHRQPEYRDCPASSLEITELLAARVIGLPMASDLGGTSIVRIIGALSGRRL